MGSSKLINSSAVFLFEVPGSNLPLVVQELQIGGTSALISKLVSDKLTIGHAGWRRGHGEAGAALLY